MNKTAKAITNLFGSKIKYDSHGQMIWAVNDKIKNYSPASAKSFLIKYAYKEGAIDK